jgi:molybdopterin molybdotransferase
VTRLAQVVSCLDDYDPDALPVDAARRVIRSVVQPVDATERVAIRAAFGRVLGADLVAGIDLPAHDNAAMDGWAVRGADLAAAGETMLTEVGRALAGHPYAGVVGAGECVRIMTGAVLPAGCDTVVLQEAARADGARIAVPSGVVPGQNRRVAGEDVARGSAVLRAGQVLTPADLGLAANLGLTEITVKRRVRVAFFATGDELVPAGTPLAPGAVYDSNRYALYGLLSRLGVESIDLGVVRDDPYALERALRTAAECADAVVSSGGVSVGEADFTRELLGRLGEVLLWRIAMRPGRPMAFGRIASGGRSALFFGLPGNPVAVLVTFYALVREALLALGGRTGDIGLPLVQAASEAPLAKQPGRTEFQRGIASRDATGRLTVRPAGQPGWGALRSMAAANCLIVLQHSRGPVAAGEAVPVALFETLA